MLQPLLYVLIHARIPRVAIAGIIAMMPDCMIFDESTAMLDPVGRAEVMKVVSELNKKEKSFLEELRNLQIISTKYETRNHTRKY